MNSIFLDRVSPILILIMIIGLNIYIWSDMSWDFWIFGLMTSVVSIFALGLAIECWRDF